MVSKHTISVLEVQAFLETISKKVHVGPFQPVHIHLNGPGIDWLSDLTDDFRLLPSNVTLKCVLGPGWRKDYFGNHILDAEYVLDIDIDQYFASLDKADPKTALTVVITDDDK